MTFRARRSFGTVALFLVLSVTEGLLTHRPFLRPVVAPYTQERTPWKPDDFGHCSYTFVRKSFSQRDEVEQAASNGVEGDEVQLSEIAEDYASRHTEAESADLKDIRMVTERTQPGSAHMVSGHLQGELLKLLTRLTGAKRVLDIGTFTGYSALAFAEALPSDGVVMTLEIL